MPTPARAGVFDTLEIAPHRTEVTHEAIRHPIPLRAPLARRQTVIVCSSSTVRRRHHQKQVSLSSIRQRPHPSSRTRGPCFPIWPPDTRSLSRFRASARRIARRPNPRSSSIDSRQKRPHRYPPEGGRRMPYVDSMNSRSSAWTRFLPRVFLATTRVRGVDIFERCSPFRMNPESVVLVP